MRYSLRSLFRNWTKRKNPVRTQRRSKLGLNTLESRFNPGGVSTASLGDFVWFDANNNGIQNAGEAGIPNITVNLLNSAGDTVLKTTQTDGNGLYGFKSLTPGNYRVQFVKSGISTFSPANVGTDDKSDSDADQTTGITGVVNLSAGENDTTVDAGLFKPTTAKLGDRVWFDSNNNGVQDSGELGIPNITVNLLNSAGTQLKSTTTDSSGLYLFSDLAPGGYRVQFTKPASAVFSPSNVGNDATDSDADQATGITGIVTLAAGETNLTVDAGIFKPEPPKKGKLGDFVWLDTNCSGVFDKGEQGLAGVTVKLLNGSGVVIQTTTTDANGFYLFENLDAGNYSVEFTLPAGFTFTRPNVGGDDSIDSDVTSGSGPGPIFVVPIGGVPVTPPTWVGKSDQVALAAGQTDLKVDAGVLVLKGISGFVYLDTNDNGVFDPNELPIPNVQINMTGTDHNGNTVNLSGLTDATGKYQINNVVPGTYTISEVQPVDFFDGKDTLGTPFTAIVGNDQFSSLKIDCGATNKFGSNYNFGERVSSIRGTVWYDINNNGVQDAGEPGIAGVKVTLTGTQKSGAEVNRVLYTGADGTYLFTGLRAGTYTLTETQPTLFQDGKDRLGTPFPGVVGNDVISNIQVNVLADGFGYDFGEILTNNGKGNKEDLLASSKNTPAPGNLAQSKFLPGSPTYANAVSASKLSGPSILHFGATGQATGGSRVRVFDFTNGATKYEFDAYPGFNGGVRVAVADVTGDAVPDIITAPGAGGGPHIKVFSGATGNLVSQFLAYGAGVISGLYVAAGDFNGDGTSEIVTAPDQGNGSHVRIFNAGGIVQNEFFAYAPSVYAGIRLAAGDFNGDGKVDVITVPGAGVNSHVKVFSGGNAAVPLLASFYAYGAGFSGGAYIASGDVDGDGKSDIVTGAGEGGGPHVRVFKGGTNGTVINDFFAYEPTFHGGVRVGALDINGDGKADVMTAPASNFTSFVQVRDMSRGASMEAFLAYDANYLGGAFVTGGTRRNLPDSLGG